MTWEGSFDAVVFAGGGSRCFWQLGFWQVVAPRLGLDDTVRRAAGVSAGSAMACASLLDRCRQTLELFCDACAQNPQNVYPSRLVWGGRVFPHERMYRRAVVTVVDADALTRLQRGPDLRIVYGHPPGLLGARAGLLWGLACYLAERRAGDPVHGGLALRAGFSSAAESVRSCRTPEELADLILASSCTPPFTGVYHRSGRPVVDGSLVDSAPVSALSGSPQKTLVLLSRSYGTLAPTSPDRVYVTPSEPVPVGKWDYTNPHGLRRAWTLGQKDGEAFLLGR